MKFGRGYESNEVEREKTHAGIYLIIKFKKSPLRTLPAGVLAFEVRRENTNSDSKSMTSYTTTFSDKDKNMVTLQHPQLSELLRS